MSGRSRALLRVSPLLSAMFLGGCGIGGPAHQAALPNAAGVVDMGLETYNPTILYIRAGQTVQWRNASIITHSVTDDSKLAVNPADAVLPAGAPAFNSGDISAGNIFTYTFHSPGTYKYFCTHHEGMGMVGTVVVAP